MLLHYALIGCGRIARNHIAAAKIAGFRIVALCDIDTDAAIQLAATSGIENATIYSDYHIMLDKIKPDVVSIATPSGSHAAIAIACCKAGCNTIIEKPVALSHEDAYTIKESAKENHVMVTVCHQNRYNPSVMKAMEIVRSGMLGKIYSVNANILWNRDECYYKKSEWRGTWTQDGGVLMNQCIHNIDLMRWFAGGKITQISSLIRNYSHSYIEVEDYGAATICFDNNCCGMVCGTTNVYPSNLEETLYILGSNGTIKLGGKSVNTIEILNVKGLDDAEQIRKVCSVHPPNVYGNGHVPLFQDFYESVSRGHEPYISIQDAIDSLELVLGIYKSAMLNDKVVFPLKHFSMEAMKGYFCGI